MFKNKVRYRNVGWEEPYASQGHSLLKAFEDTSLFFLNNLVAFGPYAGEAPYSGNATCLVDECDRVRAVFCLSQKGSLIFQTDRVDDYSAQIYEALQIENIPLTACFADWLLLEPLWAYVEQHHPTLKTTASSKETLYTLAIAIEEASKKSADESNVKLLALSDFDQWLPLRIDYMAELSVPDSLNTDEKFQEFKSTVNAKKFWGLFLDGKLISMAGYNARYENVAQIGGVYTTPIMRGQGFSKSVIAKIIQDSRIIHQVNKLILFTNEENRAAQRVYESQGFRHQGYYGFKFGTYS